MKKLSFVTACMGRLEHLKQTLPRRIHPQCENIIVDWSCPDKCGNWVEDNFPNVKVVRIPGQKYFHQSKSRNVGFKEATGEFICIADADLIVNFSFYKLLSIFNHNNYYSRMSLNFIANYNKNRDSFALNERSEQTFQQDIRQIYQWTDEEGNWQKSNASLFGCIVFPRSILTTIGGFDNDFDRYGAEDMEFRIRMVIDGKLGEQIWEHGHVDSISHSDALRVKYHKKDQRASEYKNFVDHHLEGRSKVVAKWGKDWPHRVTPLLTQRSK